MSSGDSSERMSFQQGNRGSGWRRLAALVALAVAALGPAAGAPEADQLAAPKQLAPATGAADKFKAAREQVQEAYYADGWSPHHMEPTFTDQEQGDEMVALAAEPEPYVARLQPANKTTGAPVAITSLVAPNQEPPGKRFREPSVKRPQMQPADEYYSEEEGVGAGEDDNEPASSRSLYGVNDYGSASYAFERKDAAAKQQPDRAATSSSWLPKTLQQSSSHPSKPLSPLAALGKTDAAIEYLRGVLQRKQQTSSSKPQLVSASATQQAPAENHTNPASKQENLQRLSLFASRLTQLLNNVTAASQAAGQPKPATTPQSAPATNHLDTKFKIEDAKQLQQQQQVQQVQAVASAIHPSASGAHSTDFHNYEYEQPQVDAPNGTPVGGDYLESQDDFLRGARGFLAGGGPVLPEAVSLEQPSQSIGNKQEQLAPAESSHSYLGYGREPREPRKPAAAAAVEPRYELRGAQLAHATSSRYFRLGNPTDQTHEPVRPNIPLNYQPAPIVKAQHTIPYDVVENKPVKNATVSEHQVTSGHKSASNKSQHRPLVEPPRVPPQSKIYNYERPPPVAEHYLPKAPKIVSYNYFESPNEGGERDALATNFKLGDALYSSSGSLEHMLSNSELEAIQNQFVSAEHPVVGVDQHQHQDYSDSAPHGGDSHLASLLDSLKSDPLRTEGSDKKQVVAAAAPALNTSAAISDFSRDLADLRQKGVPQAVLPLQLDSTSALHSRHSKKEDDVDAKKNLIVYLNHPRPDDMSHSKPAKPEGEQYVAAKEFDSQGISKDNKYLDVADLNDYSELKNLQDKDKDGLSVVVIGDAYKYKKIVLLISSKAGGLKFIPMVKDNRK